MPRLRSDPNTKVATRTILISVIFSRLVSDLQTHEFRNLKRMLLVSLSHKCHIELF